MKKAEKILVITAHDDDMVIAIGGILLLYYKGANIHQLVGTSCENSHRLVLGIEQNPSPKEVRQVRDEELQISNQILANHGLYISTERWGIPECVGFLPKNMPEIVRMISKLIERVNPDGIFFHDYDGHEDHRAYHLATKDAMKAVGYTGYAATFAIWTKQVAADNPELVANDIPEPSEYAEFMDVSSVINVKREALLAFKSQIELNPYPELGWNPQEKAILKQAFLDYFLRGEEIVTRVSQ